MVLDGLRKLCSSMKSQDMDRYKFNFKYNNVSFDVFFFRDKVPFVLMFGVWVDNFYFEIEVRKGFIISDGMDNDDYNNLLKILKLNPDSNSPFKPKYFFEEFNRSIPPHANINNRPKAHEIAYYKRDVEEANKIYFCGWRDNTIQSEHVSGENLKKTRILLGEKAYQRCIEKNISSRWTDNPSREIDYYIPKF